MKKIYMFFALLGLGAVATAQTHQTIGIRPMQKTFPMDLQDRVNGTYYLDLGAYDGSLNAINWYGGITDGTYSYQNNNADTLPYSFAVAYERFDTLITTSDFANFDFTTNSDVWSVVVDSIFIWFNHDNTSGLNDSILVHMVGLDGSRRPSDSNILWGDTLTSNSALGNGVVLGLAPGVTRSGSNWGFALRVEYRDASMLDTFNIVFGQLSNCTPSEVYPACFYRVNLGGAGAGGNGDNSILVPTATDAGVWYDDCNGNMTPDWPEENSFTHWGMWAKVTVAEDAGVDEQMEKGIRVYNYPNPSSDFTTINFELNNAAQVNLFVSDLSGKQIMSANLGQRNSGKNNYILNTENLSSGIYMYTLDVDGVQITRRLVVK